MKINCIYVSNNLISTYQNETLELLAKELLTFGLTFNSVKFLKNDSEQILSCLKGNDANLNIVVTDCNLFFNAESYNAVVIKDDLKELKQNFIEKIVPHIMTNGTTQTTMLKVFGIPEKEILSVINDIITANPEIHLTTYSKDLDTTIVVIYDANTNQQQLNNFIASIYERLRKFIYSDEDTSLYQLALDLLTIGNRTLSIFETITGGNISSEFNMCNFAPSLISQANATNNETTLVKDYGVNAGIVKKYGLVSVESTYEIASAILEKKPNDVVLVTCGDIQDDKNVCYIAIGDSEGIHVYKNSYGGSKKQIVNTISKCAVFYLVKKLKQNDLFFNKIYV